MGAAQRLHRGYENHSYDFTSNGEARVLDLVGRVGRPRCVFDVGANIGDWATLAAQTFPGASIHAFEIVPETAAVLQARVGNDHDITLNAIGLSDREGCETVHISEGQSPIATCVPNFADDFHHITTAPIEVRTTTGGSYCSRHGITSIDFLKIDVEGFEDRVLAGFGPMLETGAVRVVQFEYGWVNIASRFLLEDFYDLLVPLGYAIGKIYPTYVDFRPYRHRHEDFLGPNFLAVLESEVELMDALSTDRPR